MQLKAYQNVLFQCREGRRGRAPAGGELYVYVSVHVDNSVPFHKTYQPFLLTGAGYMKQEQDSSETFAGATAANGSYHARIACYDQAERRSSYWDVAAEDLAAFVIDLCGRLEDVCSGSLDEPALEAIGELAENLIHTSQRSMAVLVVQGEKLSLVFSDNGPGIADKELAMQPGFTTATEEMRARIKGVGLGLYRAADLVRSTGGEFSLADNLGGGTVVRLELPVARTAERARGTAGRSRLAQSQPTLSRRQNDVLFLLTEMGEAGPRLIANELKISISTAHRELLFLEKSGLIGASQSGKRFLTAAGRAYLQKLLAL